MLEDGVMKVTSHLGHNLPIIDFELSTTALENTVLASTLGGINRPTVPSLPSDLAEVGGFTGAVLPPRALFLLVYPLWYQDTLRTATLYFAHGTAISYGISAVPATTEQAFRD